MNGIIILVCGLLLLLAIKLLIERNFIGLVLFSVALFLIFLRKFSLTLQPDLQAC